jgi:hypothetical protein
MNTLINSHFKFHFAKKRRIIAKVPFIYVRYPRHLYLNCVTIAMGLKPVAMVTHRYVTTSL